MAAADEGLPGTSAAADAEAAAAAVAEKPQKSALRRAKEEVAVLVAHMHSLMEDHRGEIQVEFADATVRILEALLHGRCVPSVEIARLERLSHADDGDAGTTALIMVGKTLRSMSIARNEFWTTKDGFEPDQYGLPKLTMRKPKYYRGESDESENVSPGGTHAGQKKDQKNGIIKEEPACSQSGRTIKDEPAWSQCDEQQQVQQSDGEVEMAPLFAGGIAPAEDEGDRNCTSGWLDGATGSVDVTKLPPVRRDESEAEREAEERRRPGKKKYYPPAGPPPPFEYRCDEQGNVLVKSEMMGDDEFFDHQIGMRELALRYEQLAATGQYEERFIMKHIAGRGTRGGKTYKCDQCGVVCPNQHKFAAHKRYTHPKSGWELAEAAAARAEKKKSANAATAVVTFAAPMERQRRERRAPAARDEIVSMAGKTGTSPPMETKIYTCPICDEVLDSQHKFASHMRYKHPKGSVLESMIGRRASVTKIQVASTSSPVAVAPSPLLVTASSMTASDQKAMTMTMMTPSADTTSMMTNGDVEVTEETEGEAKAYPCPVCGRIFATVNKLGGHTGHCRRAHGLPPAMTVTSPSVTPKMTTITVTTPSGGAEVMTVTAEAAISNGAETVDENPDTPQTPTMKTYSCNICARTFDGFNGMAGHTRHCMKANGLAVYPTAPLATPLPSPVPKHSSTTSSAHKATKITSDAVDKQEQTTSMVTPSEDKQEEVVVVPPKKPKREKEETGKQYSCNICARVFEVYNALSGHTRYCMKANDILVYPSAPLATPLSYTPPVPRGARSSSEASSARKAIKKKAAAETEANRDPIPTATPSESNEQEFVAPSKIPKEEKEERQYSCNICGRVFDGYNGMAGHTRHCMKANGIAVYPSAPLASPLTYTPTPRHSKANKKSSSETDADQNPIMKTPSDGKMEEAAGTSKERTPKLYSCQICGRSFDNHNSLAGHTRHCMKANGIEPSPRALLRREQVAAAVAAGAVEREEEGGKSAALPPSLLSLPLLVAAALSSSTAAAASSSSEQSPDENDDKTGELNPPVFALNSAVVEGLEEEYEDEDEEETEEVKKEVKVEEGEEEKAEEDAKPAPASVATPPTALIPPERMMVKGKVTPPLTMTTRRTIRTTARYSPSPEGPPIGSRRTSPAGGTVAPTESSVAATPAKPQLAKRARTEAQSTDEAEVEVEGKKRKEE